MSDKQNYPRVPPVLLNSSYLSLKSISVIICLPWGLENEAFSICCVLVSCIGTVISLSRETAIC